METTNAIIIGLTVGILFYSLGYFTSRRVFNKRVASMCTRCWLRFGKWEDEKKGG